MTRTQIERKLAEALDELDRVAVVRELSKKQAAEIRARVLADVALFIDAKFEVEVARMRDMQKGV